MISESRRDQVLSWSVLSWGQVDCQILLTRTQVARQVWDQVRDQVWNQVGKQIQEQVYDNNEIRSASKSEQRQHELRQ